MLKYLFTILYLINQTMACDLQGLLKQYSLSLDKSYQGDKGKITIKEFVNFDVDCTDYNCELYFDTLIIAEAGSWKDQYVYRHVHVSKTLTLGISTG
jgi:hypothetical protein